MIVDFSGLDIKEKYAHAFMKEKLSDHIITLFDYVS